MDDDEDDFFIFQDLISELPTDPVDVRWVRGYQEALVELEHGGYDVLFFDYRLGGHTGLELLAHSLRLSPETPVIILTGYNDRDVDWRAIREGADDYLEKGGLTAKVLHRAIRYALARAEARKSLRVREMSFRNLLDSLEEGLVVYDSSGTILDTNAVLASQLQIETSAMVGLPLSAVLPADVVQRLRVPQNFSKADTFEIELKVDDEPVLFNVVSKPYNYQGTPGVLSAFIDITERRSLETQVLRQDRLASLGLLASSLAHEIGTPLGIMQGRAEMLRAQAASQPEMVRNAEAIVRQIERVSQLVRSLLNLGRGSRSGDSVIVSVLPAVRDVLDLVAGPIRESRIEVFLNVPDSLAARLRTQGETLQQVLLNLVVNAVHAIQTDGTRAGRLEIHGESVDSGHIELTVRDNGVGISSENLRHLFKPFFTTKPIGQGTGLGLATCYRLINSWNGTIDVESSVGHGTVFRIRLPEAKD